MGESTGVRYLDWIKNYDEEYDGWLSRGTGQPRLDLILMVFDETDQVSLFNIKTKLHPELRNHSKKVPIALIGMRSVLPQYLDIWPNMWKVVNQGPESSKALNTLKEKQGYKAMQEILQEIVHSITNATEYPKVTRIMSAKDDRSACELLSEDDDLELTFCNSLDENLLHVLVKRGFRKSIDVLKEKFSKNSNLQNRKSVAYILNWKDSCGNSPLIAASEQGRKEIFETIALLCRDKALDTFGIQNRKLENFVHIIARNDFIDLLDSLIHNVFDTKNPDYKACLANLFGQEDKEMKTPLMSITLEKESKCLAKLSALYLDIAFHHTNKPNSKAENFLHLLAKQSCTDAIDGLIKKTTTTGDEMDKNSLMSLLRQKDKTGCTPLRIVLDESHPHFKRYVHLYMQNAFSEMTAQNLKGENFLHISCRLGLYSLIGSLIDKFTTSISVEDSSCLATLLDQKNSDGNSPLLIAVANEQTECFFQLLSYTSTANVQALSYKTQIEKIFYTFVLD